MSKETIVDNSSYLYRQLIELYIQLQLFEFHVIIYKKEEYIMPRGNPQNLVPVNKRGKEEATNGDKK